MAPVSANMNDEMNDAIKQTAVVVPSRSITTTAVNAHKLLKSKSIYKSSLRLFQTNLLSGYSN